MEVTLNINYVLIFAFISALLLFKCLSLYRQNKQLQKDYEEASDESFNDLLNIVGLSEKLKVANCKQEEFECYCQDTQAYIQHLEELLKVNNINIDQVTKTQERIEEEDLMFTNQTN